VIVPVAVTLVGSVTACGLVAAHARYRPAALTRTVVPHVQRRHTVMFGMSGPTFLSKTARVQAAQLRAMKAMGITSIRLDANWAWIQPNSPRSFFWAKLDQAVHSVLSAKMSVDLIIEGCPQWAALHHIKNTFAQPASARQFSIWAAEVARRYKPRGVKIFEIWNEPNDSLFFEPKANPAAYTAMLKASYRAIKAVNRSAEVISGGLAPVAPGRPPGSISTISFLKGMYAHGAHGYFDALGDHPYCFPALPNTYESWSAWSQMYQTAVSIRGLMKRYHDAYKKIWITEFGAPTSGPRGISLKGQAVELTQGILDSKKISWIAAFYIYTWQDNARSNYDYWGLLTVRGKRKPAYAAVIAAIKKR